MIIPIKQKEYLDDISVVKIKQTFAKKSISLSIFSVHENKPQKISIRQVKLKKNNILTWFNFSFSKAIILSLLCIVLLSTIGFFSMPSLKINSSLVIKDFIRKQTSPIVANLPVNYTIIVKRSSVASNQYLIPIPQKSTHINIQSITTEKALRILSEKTPLPQLALGQRQQLADAVGITQSDQKNVLAMVKQFITSSSKKADSAIHYINLSDQADDKSIIKNLTNSMIVHAATIDSSDTQGDSSESSSDQSSSSSVGVVVPTNPQSPSGQPLQDNPSSDNAAAKINLAPVDTVLPISQLDNSILLSETTPLPEQNISIQTDSMASEETDYIQIDYQLPAPVITQQDTNSGKEVIISAINEDPQTLLTNVLAYSHIPELFRVGQESHLKISWKNNNNQEMPFTAQDLNNNGYIDYVEWIVPHLSEQTFDIMYLSKAFQIDANKKIIADIYDAVRMKDGNYATIGDGQYIKIYFEKALTKQNDITLQVKPSDSEHPAIIQVYPVDSDGNFPNHSIATFETIDHLASYTVSLVDLPQPTEIFLLKIIGSADIDHITDPGLEKVSISLIEKPIFSQEEQSSVFITPSFGDGSTNIAFYIPYGKNADWMWQSETPAIGDLSFSDYWGPTPAIGKYTAIEYTNDTQQFSCSDLSLEDCIKDPHFISKINFEISE